jgi:capsular polysaccharide transport system permease protein
MRRTVLGFRLRNQIHIAESDAESKMGVVSALQTQLASELVDRQTILNFTGSSDTRIVNIDRRIQAIQNQITVEREELDRQFNESRPLSAIKSEYEALLVDLQFAENAYSAAYEAEKQLRTETHLRNRYLSVHIPPTLSDSSIYPHRALLLGTIIACMFAAWAICGLMFFNMIDRS